LGRLKSAVYTRMEEMSFRSGAVVAGGVATAAGVAVTLAVVLGGHSDASAGVWPLRPDRGHPRTPGQHGDPAAGLRWGW